MRNKVIVGGILLIVVGFFSLTLLSSIEIAGSVLLLTLGVNYLLS